MKNQIKIKKNQLWRSKTSNQVIKISSKATGNLHWNIVTDNKKSMKIHEGTLKKFYDLV